MLLQKQPELRQDQGTMRSYMFLMDFLEAVGNEMSTRIKNNQQLLKGLLEASKVSEAALDEYISTNSDKVVSRYCAPLMRIPDMNGAICHHTADLPRLQDLPGVRDRERGERLAGGESAGDGTAAAAGRRRQEVRETCCWCRAAVGVTGAVVGAMICMTYIEILLARGDTQLTSCFFLRRMGVDVMILPKLAALTDPAELRAKVRHS